MAIRKDRGKGNPEVRGKSRKKTGEIDLGRARRHWAQPTVPCTQYAGISAAAILLPTMP